MKMKKTIILSTILGAMTLFNSCSESFIDLDPNLDLKGDAVYTDAGRIEGVVQGIYTTLKNPAWIGSKTYIAFDNRGEDIYNIGTNLVTLYDTYTMNVGITYSENTDGWTNAYLAINRANVLFEELDMYDAAATIGAEKVAQYKAEAKFVRSLSFYYLSQLFSMPYVLDPNAPAVPLRLTGITGPGHNDLKRSTISEVYNQILSDLDAATISALPTGVNTPEATTRATQAAAHMLKMRIYMAMENWSAAIAEGEAIAGYSLGNIRAMFDAPYFTAETIFAFPMSTNDRGNTQQAPAGFYNTERICLVDTKHGIMGKPAYSLDTDVRKQFIGGNSGERFLKWDDSSTRLQWTQIFRYAETLLNLAECYAEVGETAKAQDALHAVRSRAIPTGDIIDVKILTGDALLLAIEDEKRLEFLGEGMRGIEIIRKGQNFVKERINVVTTPDDGGYIWPIPNVETLINKALND
jgi:SusD family.